MAKKQGRVRRWLIGVAVFFVVYAVIGFFVLPPIVRGQIEKHATEALKREVTVGKVSMNPFTFAMSVADLKVADPAGGLLASWKIVEVNFDPLTSLFRWQFYLSEARMVEPKKWIRIDKDGRLNVADLLESAPSEEEDAEVEVSSLDLPPIGVGKASIEGWAVDFTDETRRTPFHAVVGPMDFLLNDFTTRPDENSPYSFQGTTGTGESFSWSGTVSVNPLGSKGSIQFSGFTIPKYAPYAEEFSRAEVQTGTVAFSTDYDAALSDQLVLKLANTRLAVEDLALSSPEVAEPKLAIDRIEVDMPEADGVARTAHVSRVAVDGVNVAVERRADGSIDLLDWIVEQQAEAPPAGAAPVGATADTGPAPSVAVDEIVVSNARVEITDQTTPEPAVLVVDQANVAIGNAGTDLDREVEVDMKLRVNEGGTVSVAGKVRPLPFAASFAVTGDAVTLAPFTPYARQFADIQIASGTVSWSGNIKAEQPPGGELDGSWTGDASLADLSILGSGDGKELFSLGSLGLNGTEFDLQPLSVKAAEVAIAEPKAHVIMDADGRINLLTAMRVDQEVAEEETASEEGADEEKTSEMVARATRQKLPFDARVDAVSITDGRFTFSDDSVPGGFSTSLQDFGGTITGLSSENVARADVDLRATLDGQAPLRITGSINPLAEDVYSDIAVAFSNIDLPIFSPYAGKYIGQKIEKGKLQVDITYRVSQAELDGENAVVFDQFYLGEKVESPDALKLPVGLALALLRDREGKISLDVPVRGNLDDPDFKYGRAVMKVIGNILVKAATSPFSMLGGIVGGGGAAEDLSYVDFASGSAVLDEAAIKKVGLLNKALFERPALRLEIKVPPSPETDRAGLIEARFLDLLRSEKAAAAAEESAGETAAANDAGVEIAPEEVNDLVKRVFARLYPEEAAALAAAQGEAPADEEAPVVDTAPEPAAEKQPGFFSRVLGSVFRRGEGQDQQPAVPPSPPATPEAEAETAEEPTGEPVPALTVAEMRDRIMETIEITENDFRELAAARSRALRDAILAPGGVEAERVFLVETSTVPEGATASTEGGRAFFGLQ